MTRADARGAWVTVEVYLGKPGDYEDRRSFRKHLREQLKRAYTEILHRWNESLYEQLRGARQDAKE